MKIEYDETIGFTGGYRATLDFPHKKGIIIGWDRAQVIERAIEASMEEDNEPEDWSAESKFDSDNGLVY